MLAHSTRSKPRIFELLTCIYDHNCTRRSWLRFDDDRLCAWPHYYYFKGQGVWDVIPKHAKSTTYTLKQDLSIEY